MNSNMKLYTVIAFGLLVAIMAWWFLEVLFEIRSEVKSIKSTQITSWDVRTATAQNFAMINYSIAVESCERWGGQLKFDREENTSSCMKLLEKSPLQYEWYMNSKPDGGFSLVVKRNNTKNIYDLMDKIVAQIEKENNAKPAVKP